MDDNVFMSIKKGKCEWCNEMKPLDEMIMHDKGAYHCNDCETVKLSEYYDKFSDLDLSEPETQTKLKKLLGWCFG